MTNGSGKLIICPTPLGNLGDMTRRALDALRTCNVVCCEDTRVTGKLLAALDLSKRLERLDEASIARKAEKILDRIEAGERVCYCSDAGMPGVSDPGQRLIELAYDRNLPVEVLPGPTAVTTAYVASGFTTPNFYFASFFPRKEGERKAVLENLSSLDAALIFYESPNRLVSALECIASALPLRRVAVCRELTKIYEEVVRGISGDVAQEFASRAEKAPIKGEIVIVIDAASGEELDLKELSSLDAAKSRASELLGDGELTKKQIVALLQEEFSLSRNDTYEIVHGV